MPGANVISVNAANRTVTCVGCTFPPEVLVGDVMIIPDAREDAYALPHLISAISVDRTTLTVANAFGNPSNIHFQVGKRWQTGDRGFLYSASHHYYDPFNGGSPGVIHP